MKSTIVRCGLIAWLSFSSSLLAEAPSYKVEKSFGQDEIKESPVCVSVDAKDQLYVLLEDGSVLTFDPEGKKTSSFKADMKPEPTTMTVADGKIYLFNTLTTEKVVEVRGKKVKRNVPDGIGCSVFDPAGTKVSALKLPEAVSASDAHFIGQELAVADLNKSQIVYYELNGAEGKVARKIDKAFRLCCGIFDFCPGTEPDTLVVANLGAFKVQTFKAGQKTVEFGQRGTKPEEFHGCCNPVNVACLADGSIVTVEKSPTRVKIYDKEGKTSTKVTGLTELVEGCSTIPIAVDSKGSIYLASSERNCIVKCVPGVSDKPEPAEPVEEAEPGAPELSPAMVALQEKVGPLLEAKEYAKANEEVKAFLKANPDTPEDMKLGLTLGIGLAPLIESGNIEASNKLVDEVLAAYPKNELAKHGDEIKAQIKEQIEAAKEMKKEEAADKDKKDEAAAPAKPSEPPAPKEK